jgi:DNA-binding XRE family transcriptional regulator
MNKNALKAMRAERGLTNASIAVSAKVSTATITLIERYGFEPRQETKDKIAAVLGVDSRTIWPSGEQSDPPSAA